jgi:RHS repeat-associated protein
MKTKCELHYHTAKRHLNYNSITHQFRKTTAGSVTDYCGNFIYADNQLITIFAGDVRVAPVNVGNSTYWKYEYSMKDHTSTYFDAAQHKPLSASLGNVRVVFAAHSHGQPELLQQTSYYPFGMILNQQSYYSQNATENKFLYNSKELQDDQLAGNTLDWYDYGARFYDATLGRWHVVDPLGEKYYSISTYAYVANNPMIFIDPDGMRIDDFFNQFGRFLGYDNAPNDRVRIVTQDEWDRNKTVTDDDIETIDHNIGSSISVLHSEANFPIEASLAVYDHYNPTDLNLLEDKDSGSAWGMSFSAVSKNGDTQVSIKVKLKGNKEQKISDNANEIINLFSHEEQHNSDFKTVGLEGYISIGKSRREQIAVTTQINHDSFGKTHSGFQRAVKSYGGRFGLINRLEPITVKNIIVD